MSDRSDTQEIPAWRYQSGLAVFVIGNLGTLSSPVVIPLLGLSAAYIGVMVIVSELVILSSVFLIGWKGLKQLKSRVLCYFWTKLLGGPVGRLRFRLGLFFTFALSAVLNYTAFLLVVVAYAQTTVADPFPTVLGLGVEAQGWVVGCLFIGGEITVLLGLLLLGEEWWGRFRQLFIWSAPEGSGAA